ncbi:MAG: toxin-antitoxin system HicB family antitoxin [Deltaproteobacteria bacterium]|nr:toxin-antitoxin system HicB family antitoxin [Deltaproteobacteria bacterium]
MVAKNDIILSMNRNHRKTLAAVFAYPVSGKLTLRIPPNVHAAIATTAETSGKSLNKWIADILNQATHAH